MTDTNTETEALRADIEALRQDLKNLASDVRSSGDRHARESLDQIRELYEDVRKQANEHGENLSAGIEARPLTSVLAAFGIGLLLGKIFGR